MSGRVPILGIPIDSLTKKEILPRCAVALDDARLLHIVTANPEILLHARQDSAYAALLRSAELMIPDGVGIMFAARILGQRLPERIPGIELVKDISALAVERGNSVFLLGGRHGVAEEAAQRLRADVTLLRKSVTSGAEEEEGEHSAAAVFAFLPDHEAENPPPELWQELMRARPAVLFVAYGAPKQERWVAQHRERLESLGVRIAMGVGGAFDTLSGRLPRAPRWMRSVGLEWLWRLIREPRRFPRILRATFLFPWEVFWDRKRSQNENAV